jgi:glycine oxidase
MKIAIIGAGLAGRVLAWRLNECNQDMEITLIDQHDRHHKGTGLVAAAMIAPFTEAATTEAITQHLGVRSYELWAKWLVELESTTHQKVSFNQQGTLVVSHTQDDASWQRFQMKANAMIAEEHVQALDQQNLHKLEPELAHNFSKGLFFPEEGVINNQTLYPALNDYFDQSSAIEWHESLEINLDESANYGIIDGFNDCVFDYVFDCRGNGARADLTQLRSVRGEVVSVYAPEVNFTRAIRLMHPRYPLYIAPRGDHHYIIGATQLENDNDGPITIRSGLELLSALYSLHPGFGEAQIIDMLSGLRPTFNNNLPEVFQQGRLVRINGLYRHGYLFAPALINDLITQLFREQEDVCFPQFLSMNPVNPPDQASQIL